MLIMLTLTLMAMGSALRLPTMMATCTQAEADKVIGLAKTSIARDATVKRELGSLQKVQSVLGFGKPTNDIVAVSFNASFRRPGGIFRTMSGEAKTSNRGATVGKVSAKAQAGKLLECVIAKDGGWGKSINVRV